MISVEHVECTLFALLFCPGHVEVHSFSPVKHVEYELFALLICPEQCGVALFYLN